MLFFLAEDERRKGLSVCCGTGFTCQKKKKQSHAVCDYSLLGKNLPTLSVLRIWKMIGLFTQGVTRASVVYCTVEVRDRAGA